MILSRELIISLTNQMSKSLNFNSYDQFHFNSYDLFLLSISKMSVQVISSFDPLTQIKLNGFIKIPNSQSKSCLNYIESYLFSFTDKYANQCDFTV